MVELNKRVKEAVAGNIRKYRMIAYPGAGGATRCAKALNISLQQWSLWENGRRTPSARNLKRIACVLNVSVAVLCDVAPGSGCSAMKTNAGANCLWNLIDAVMRLVSCRENAAAPSDYDGIRCCPFLSNVNAPHHHAGCFTLPFWHDK